MDINEDIAAKLQRTGKYVEDMHPEMIETIVTKALDSVDRFTRSEGIAAEALSEEQYLKYVMSASVTHSTHTCAHTAHFTPTQPPRHF